MLSRIKVEITYRGERKITIKELRRILREELFLDRCQAGVKKIK